MKLTSHIKIKKMDNRGSAMITAIVAGVVMAVFCLSLLLVTYTLYAQTARRNVQIQCKYAAGNMAAQLETQLKDKESELYKGLNAEIRKQNPDGSYSGTWAPVGNSSSEADDIIEYKLDYLGSEEAFKAYDFDVSFRYTKTGEEVSEAGGEAADYDGQFTDSSEADPDVWDEMAGSSTGTGNYVVTMEITCSRGDTVFVVTRDVEVPFE
jgi:hypothetical protein